LFAPFRADGVPGRARGRVGAGAVRLTGVAAFDLVVFDNDGVLVDSEVIANTVLSELLTGLGVPTTLDESVERYLGGSIGRVRAIVEADVGRRLPADFEARYHRAVFARFRSDLQAVPGVAAVLADLRTDRCVASSGTHDRIRLTLGLTGLLAFFAGAIFSADDVAAGKPAPDLFLHAAARRDVPPGRCVVIEDSPLGVVAARAAGMTVFGFARLTPAVRLAEADAVFTDMAELTGLLGP
jgi:HAD superfamily hydrolase (TIGR01509 family)